MNYISNKIKFTIMFIPKWCCKTMIKRSITKYVFKDRVKPVVAPDSMEAPRVVRGCYSQSVSPWRREWVWHLREDCDHETTLIAMSFLTSLRH